MSDGPKIRRLSRTELRDLPIHDLLDHIEHQFEPYMVPATETPDMRKERLDRTLDEMPDLYTWFNSMLSFYDWLTDRQKELHSQGHALYKEARQRRDACERAASSAKLRYQGASRIVTLMTGEAEESRMPRGR